MGNIKDFVFIDVLKTCLCQGTSWQEKWDAMMDQKEDFSHATVASFPSDPK